MGSPTGLGLATAVFFRVASSIRCSLGSLDLPAPVPDGPAVLVVRHEAVQVTTAADPAADAVGTVVRARRRGMRTLVTVEVPGDGGTATVDAEPEPGQEIATGRPVGLRLPVEGRWVVPVEGVAVEPVAGVPRA